MEQELELEQLDYDAEDRLNEAQPWELAFERGAELANEEIVKDWYDDDEA